MVFSRVSQLFMSKNSGSSLYLGLSLGVFTVFLGSIVAALGKYLGQYFDVSAMVLSQYSICLLLSLPILIKGGLAELKTQRPLTHLIRGLGGCICFYAYYLALQVTPLVDATLLRNTAPLIVPLVIWLWLRKSIPSSRWLPLGIGFIGVLLILRPGQTGLNPWHVMGLVSGIGLAVSMVGSRMLSKTEPSQRILFYYYSISLLFALPFFIYQYQSKNLPELTHWQAWLGLLSVGLIMHVAFITYTKAYQLVPASILSPSSYFAVIFAGLFDWLLWKHLPDYWVITGSILVISGGLMTIYLANKEAKKLLVPST